TGLSAAPCSSGIDPASSTAYLSSSSRVFSRPSSTGSGSAIRELLPELADLFLHCADFLPEVQIDRITTLRCQGSSLQGFGRTLQITQVSPTSTTPQCERTDPSAVTRILSLSGSGLENASLSFRRTRATSDVS